MGVNGNIYETKNDLQYETIILYQASDCSQQGIVPNKGQRRYITGFNDLHGEDVDLCGQTGYEN